MKFTIESDEPILELTLKFANGGGSAVTMTADNSEMPTVSTAPDLSIDEEIPMFNKVASAEALDASAEINYEVGDRDTKVEPGFGTEEV